jgi:DNA repair protein RecO (recombination protein O)
MEWTDDGFVLAVRPHGETSAIASLLTRDHGRHPGLVRGGAGRRMRGILQPGHQVRATWRGRLAEHLGNYALEPMQAFAADLLRDPLRLAALSAACAVAERALPEREAHPAVYDGLGILLAALVGQHWPSIYIKWELGLLAELGYGLDLSSCAATGRNDELAYVSPRTGRAVSLSAGEPYRDKLLPLPPFLLIAGGEGSGMEIANGLRMTGYFLERNLFAPHGVGLPAARQRLGERLGA